VTMQTIVMDLPVKACKTKDNVTVNIDVALAFRIMGDPDLGEDPNLVRIFVYELTPRGLEQQLRDAQDEEVRTLARSLKHTEIYGIRSGENSKHIRDSISGSGIGGSMARKNAVDVLAGEVEEGVSEGKEEEEEKLELQPILEEGEEDEEKEVLHGEKIMENEEVPSHSVVPTHRDETLVGSADVEDQKAAVRATAAGVDVTDYMKKKLNRQFMPQGVQIVSVMIKSCLLPKEIESQMEEKTKVISKNAQQRMFHQNNMQNTRMEEEIVTLMQTFEEKKQQEESAGAERINEEKVKLNDEMAEAMKSEATIREEADASIQKLKAENCLEVQRVISRKDETIATMKAQAEKDAADLRSRTKLEVEKKLATANLTAAKNRAEASRVLARAEGIIAPYLAKKNEHITNMKQIEVYRKLASNPNFLLCDSDDSDTNVVVVADSILSEARSRGHISRSVVLAELALLRKGAGGMFESKNMEDQPVLKEILETSEEDEASLLEESTTTKRPDQSSGPREENYLLAIQAQT